MTEEHEEHLKEIKVRMVKLLDHKYRKGQKEHGGNLWSYSPDKLLEFAIEEVTDLTVYLLTLQQILKQILDLTGEMDYTPPQPHPPQEPQEPTSV